MENKTKMILTVLGLAAVIVPAVLLIIFSGGKPKQSSVAQPASGRQINKNDIIREFATPTPPAVTPSPLPSPILTSPSPSPKASPKTTPESTTSSQTSK